MFARLNGIWIERTDGMPCEWNGTCTRRSSYNLDDDGKGGVGSLNLCTQHAKVIMKRLTGQTVMAEEIEEIAERDLVYRAIAVKAFGDGWDAAMESLEAEETVC